MGAIPDGTTDSEATFNCTNFTLNTENSYCAYLPFTSEGVTKADGNAKIPVSYTGQTQTKNASTDHLGKYDYLVSDVKTPTALNTCHFTFKHMGAAVRLKLTMPEAGNWQSVTLTAADGSAAFTNSAYLTLFSDTYGYKALETNETASSITLNLSDGTNDYISTTADESVLTVWLMLAPTNLTTAGVNILVKSSDGDVCAASFTPAKAYAAGKAYSESVTMHKHEAIDLCLSSGTLWACCNIGASSPEEYGDYFMWGETSPTEAYSSTASTTYDKTLAELQEAGITDSDGILTAAYDAATVNWGSKWKMPTKAQIEELVNNCYWEQATVNGVKGMKVSRYCSTNSIFLPHAGYYQTGSSSGSGLLFGGEYGHYWSSQYYPNTNRPNAYAYCMETCVVYEDYGDVNNGFRFYGNTVRPVAK